MKNDSRQSLIERQGIAENKDVMYLQAMPKDPKHIGERLFDEMTRRALTHADIAEMFGVKPPSVYDWVNFGRIAKKHIPKLVEKLGHSANWWITGEETPISAAVPSIGAPGLADRIHELLTSADGNLTKVAAAAGTTDETVAGWLTGKGSPITLEQAVGLQQAFGVNPVWLVMGKGDKRLAVPHNDEFNPIPITKWSSIPVVGTAQLGDNGHWSDLEYPVGHGDGYIDFPTGDKDAYALRCEGDSMKPRIQAGEYVVIEPNQPVEPGDDVLMKSKDGRVMIKRFLYKRAGRTHLISVNDAHPPMAFSDDEIERLHFVRAICRPSAWRPE
jgi:phage repressor protein C with HTH and peptisase S24 domain